MDFKDKVAIVTGSAQGIGKAFVSALLNIGMKVCICDIQDDTINEFFEKLPEAQKNHVMFQRCDVSSLSDFTKAFEYVMSSLGRIDVLVNNAGIMNEFSWKKMVEVNFNGVVHGIQLAFQYMNTNKGGHGGIVINMGSCAGIEAVDLAPVYSATKYGVRGLTKSYGTDYHFERTGVKVSAVCPGCVNTSMFHSLPSNSIDKETAIKKLQVWKYIQPDEVAKALIQVLQEGKNGALLIVNNQGIRYVE